VSAIANVLRRARLLTAAAAAATAFLAIPAAAAHASTPYPAPSSPGTVSTGTVGVNGLVRFSGSGFMSGEPIVITVTGAQPNGALAVPAMGPLTAHAELIGLAASSSTPPTTVTTVTASKTGTFTASVRMTTRGVYTLTATGQLSGHVVTATVTVVGGGAVGLTAV